MQRLTCFLTAVGGVVAAVFAAQAGEVVLTADRTEVVVAQAAKRTRSAAWFAAEEMTNFLSRAFGRKVPIAFRPDPAKTSVVLGTNAWSAAAGIDLADVPTDGSRTKTAGGRVYIAGTDGDGFDIRMKGKCLNVEHGTLNGVYDFLERHVGCRFYFPGELGEIVPRTDRIVVPETDRLDKPDYLVRESTQALGEWPDGTSPEMRKLGLQYFMLRNRSAVKDIPCCHGQCRSGFSRRFGKTHPEYFLLKKDGTRQIGDPDRQANPDWWNNSAVCNSSGIWDEIYADAKSYLTGEGPEVRGMVVQNGTKFRWGPQARYGTYYDVMPNDGMHPCFCEKCQVEYAKAKDPVNYANEFIWRRVADLGNRLKRDGVKGTLTMMAYTPYRNVPDVDIPDNVAVMVCNNGPWMRGPQEREALENVRQWTEKRKGKVWLWQNTGRYNAMVQKSADVPSPTPRAFGRHYKMIAPYVFGAYCSNNSPRLLYSAINYYVFYKVSWNNATDVDALLDEYNRLMFGPAAKPMGAFLDLLEEKWMNEVMGNVEDTPVGMMAVPPSEYRFWAKIYPLSFVKRLAALVAEAERTVVPGSLEAHRVALFKRELLTPMFPHAEQYEGGGSVRREKERRAANPRPSLVPDFKPVAVEVTAAMTNVIRHGVNYKLPIRPGHRYRLSYFVRCRDVKLLHRWGGVDAVVWANQPKDKTLLIIGGGLCGTFDWICMKGEFEVPKDIKPEEFRPQLSLRIMRGMGRAEFDGLLVEEIP